MTPEDKEYIYQMVKRRIATWSRWKNESMTKSVQQRDRKR